jgi:hypothetical protein
MGIFGKEHLVFSDGKKITFYYLLLRNIIKPITIILYISVLPLFWILFPLNLDFGFKITPFDNLFGTRTKKLEQHNNSIFLINKINSIFQKFKNSISYFFKSHKNSIKISNNFEITKSKTFALYLIWFFLHFFLLIFSGKRTINSFGEIIIKLRGEYQYTTNQDLFFPLDRCEGNLLHGVYDYSEFLFYTLIPVVLYFVNKLWKNNSAIE